MSLTHLPQCTCNACPDNDISKAEKELHIEVSENSRRDFLRKAGRLGLGLGIGGGLVSTPLAAAALNNDDAQYKANSMQQNKAVLEGKAAMVSLLHTADIHSQLMIHDEFFIENGKPVYKKRGGFATLKTMINTLRKQNPVNTLVIDGGDCFQGSGESSSSSKS